MSDEKDNDGAVDMSGKHVAMKSRSIEDKQVHLDPNERQEREKAKADAKPVSAGEFIVVKNLKCDGKRFKRGDVYDGKMYPDIRPSLITKAEWENRK